MAATPKTTAHRWNVTDTSSAPRSNSNVNNGAQRAINDQAEVNFSVLRREPERKHCVGEQKMYSTCESVNPDFSPEYSTSFGSRNESTVVAHNLNQTILDTRITPPDTSFKEGNNKKTDHPSSLTESTLAAHDQYLLHHLSFDEAYASSRVEHILRAAREMGFDLCLRNVEIDRWDMPERIEAQTRLRAQED